MARLKGKPYIYIYSKTDANFCKYSGNPLLSMLFKQNCRDFDPF